MRSVFLVDDHGAYKVLVGDTIVSNPAAAYAAGVFDAAVLAQIATYTLGRGAQPLEQGATAHVDTDPSGAVVLAFFWSNGHPGQIVLQPAPT
jgi:hypothetical protein